MRRKFEIALIVARDAEDRAGAVIHQHEIRDVDRQPPFGIERVDDLDRGLEALFLGRLELGRAGAPGLAFGDKGRRARDLLAATAWAIG